MKILNLWAAMFICVGLGIYLEGGNIRTFIDLTPAMLVFAPIFVYMLFAHGLGGFPDFIRRAGSGQLNEKDCATIDVSVKLGFLFGALGLIAGLVHVSAYLEETSTIGAGLAESLVAAFYGVIPAILLLPLKPYKSVRTASVKAKRPSSLKRAS